LNSPVRNIIVYYENNPAAGCITCRIAGFAYQFDLFVEKTFTMAATVFVVAVDA
jgi:hypothetical protein